MNTKKFLHSTSYGGGKSRLKEFLIPCTGKDQRGFQGIESSQVFEYGQMVYIGKEISAKDVLFKLVNSGQKIKNVDSVIKTIESFIKDIQQFKVGNIVSISYSDDGKNFNLKKEANRPPKNENKKRTLP